MIDIATWLQQLGLERYEAAFHDNEVTADVLRDLTEADLEKLGLPLGPRKKLLKAIAALDADPVAAETSAAAPATARSGEAERRQLTVMFVDLVGSTSLSARLDPEDMRVVIRAYQNAVAGEIARVEGHVAKFMGDGVLAYFGWPQAHEDTAERAARAGLAIVGAVGRLEGGGTPLACRIGVATGLVVVGELVGEGTALEQAVIGDTPNLAARLQAIAQPGQVVVADATRRLLSRAFELADLGAQAVKGLAEPVAAFAVTAERVLESRFAARAAADPHGSAAPLIGRDAEFGVMRDRWSAACAGQGQLVLLSGEAGIGKSRITQGLIEAIPDAHARIVWQCSPYHAETTLHPAIQQIARAAGFAPGEDETARRARLDALLARNGVGGEAAALLAALMGLGTPPPIPPAQVRARTLEALIGWLENLARNGPVLWVIEDAHWIDPTTLELVDMALERIAQTRVLALVTARPTFQHGFGGHPIVTRLSLNRLGREAVAAIVARITGGKQLPAALMEEIAARTDGVPLYVEEMTKAVLESGALRETETEWQLDGPLDRLAIPTSLHDSLMARLDRLQPVKEVAQTAAVIGRAFDHATLAALSPLPEAALVEALDKLVAAELVFRRGVAPEASYLFKHALVRDAAYESLLRSKRQTLHRRLVAVLENGGAGPELLAQHAQAGGETARAVAWWREAATAAVGRGAFDEAGAQLDAAEALLGALDDPAAAARAAAAIAGLRALASLVRRGYTDPATNALYRETEARARAADDAAALLTAGYGVWGGYHVGEQTAAALATAERMLADATRHGDDDLAILGHRLRATSLTMAGRLEEALSESETARALYDPVRHRTMSLTTGNDPLIGILVYKAFALLALGYPDRARDLAREAQDVAAAAGNAVNARANALAHRGFIAGMGRWSAETGSLAAELESLAGSVGLSMWSAFAFGVSGLALLEEGDHAAALSALTRAGQALDAAGSAYLNVLWRSARAEALAGIGDDDAVAVAEEAEEHARRSGAAFLLSEAQRRQGVVLRLLRPDDHAGAEVAFRHAIATARDQNAKLWELRAACDLARLLAEQGRRDEAHDLVAPLHAWFTEGFDTPDLIEAKALLEQLR